MFWIIAFEFVENLLSPVNVFTNSPKISDLTEKDVFGLYLSLKDEKIG